MQAKGISIALAVIALCSGLPLIAQTSSITIEAESMALSSYAVENGNRIRLTGDVGTAAATFNGAAGTYNMQVYVQPESDGQSTLEVYRGATLLQSYKYPLSDDPTSFTINNVTLNRGDTIKLVGTVNAGAIARVDKIVLTPVAAAPVSSTPAAVTMEAVSMQLSSYAVENGNRIKLTGTTGTASRAFSGANGTYDVQVYVQPETDGQSTLELYKGSALLQRYTYPLSDTPTSFVVKNVTLSSGEILKLVGTLNAGAFARVEKIVLTPVSSAPAASPAVSAPFSGTPIALPRAFEAVNFDKGGQGVAYKDLTPGNSGGQFRTDDDVDITTSSDADGGPYTVTNFQAGEWLAYTVNVSSAGKYDLAVRAANGQAAGASLHIEIDGVNVSGTVPVPGTGGASTYRWFGKPDVSLTAGKHVIKVVADQQSFNMNAVSVLAAQAPAIAPAAMTIEAENMALSGYVVENGNRIRLSDDTGTASQAFSGAAGTYNIQVFVLPESDGQSTLELYRGTTLLQRYTYPLSDTPTSFMVNNVTLNSGEMLKLVGTVNAGAIARVDKMVLTPATTSAGTPAGTGTPSVPVVPTTTPTTVTIEAENMALSGYVVENGNRIRLSDDTGTASQAFSGASGTYSMQVFVHPESDGQSTLEVYRGTALLQKYTYPLSDDPTSFTISNVALKAGDPIKLVGTQNAGAIARVDKIVLTPSTAAPGQPSPAPSPAPSTGDLSACANPSGGYEGFGRNTTGGAGKPVYRVTNLNDSGAGSLRDALSQGNRCVVFDVGGTISLGSELNLKGLNVTIDGLTAPAPGITLTNNVLGIGVAGAGNVVVRGIRVRGTPGDGISVYNASNVVIDRVSVSNFGDGAIDITGGSRDVTVQWSIFGSGGKVENLDNLIGINTLRVSVHHNLYYNGSYRHPRCARDDDAGTWVPTEVVCDVRNNLIWNYVNHGTEVGAFGTGNVVNNYYSTIYDVSGDPPLKTIRVDGGGSAYVSGNYSANGWDVNGTGNRSTPYSAVVPTTTDPVTAAKQVLLQAGARGPNFGLDAEDQSYMGNVTVP